MEEVCHLKEKKTAEGEKEEGEEKKGKEMKEEEDNEDRRDSYGVMTGMCT